MARQSQVINGKAFEFAVATEFQRCLQTPIRPGPEVETCRRAFGSLTPEFSNDLVHAAEKAVDHILELERKKFLSAVPTEIWIATDVSGQRGDVRDVVVETSNGSIGISCKNNHAAFKHSRLSARVDFVKKWGLESAGCSDEYWRRVRPIFAELESIRRTSSAQTLWSELPDVATRFYWPVLDAFAKELTRLSEPDSPAAATVSKNLVMYVVGRVDFYKVIRRAESVTV